MPTPIITQESDIKIIKELLAKKGDVAQVGIRDAKHLSEGTANALILSYQGSTNQIYSKDKMRKAFTSEKAIKEFVSKNFNLSQAQQDSNTSIEAQHKEEAITAQHSDSFKSTTSTTSTSSVGSVDNSPRIPQAIYDEFHTAYRETESRNTKQGFFGCCWPVSAAIKSLNKLFTKESVSKEELQRSGINANYVDKMAPISRKAISGTQRVFDKIDQYFAQQAFLLAWAESQEKKLSKTPSNEETELVTKIKNANYTGAKDMLATYQAIKTNCGKEVKSGHDTITAFQAVSLADPFILAPYKTFLQDFVAKYQTRNKFIVQSDVKAVINAINDIDFKTTDINALLEVYNQLTDLVQVRLAAGKGAKSDTVKDFNVLKQSGNPFDAIKNMTAKSNFLETVASTYQGLKKKDLSLKGDIDKLKTINDPSAKVAEMDRIYAELAKSKKETNTTKALESVTTFYGNPFTNTPAQQPVQNSNVKRK